MDCGPTCLKMISDHYGKSFSINYLREISHTGRLGSSFRGISEAAEQIGLNTIGVRIPFEASTESESGLIEAPLPCIVHWNENHFVVVYKISAKFVWVADPSDSKMKLPLADFLRAWKGEKREGLALLFEPTPAFFEQEGHSEKKEKKGFRLLSNYFRPYRRLIIQLFLGILIGSFFQLLAPFLTKSVVDIGIENSDFGFITLILFAQLALFAGTTIVNVIQNWILLHVSTRINVSLVSDFLFKIMRLPIAFFDAKRIGDLLQRIEDQNRIENFLTTTSLGMLFSVFNFVVFGFVLAAFNFQIFLLFMGLSILFVGWIMLFMKRRKEVDYRRFLEQSEDQGIVIELIQAMPEIKLQNSEQKRRLTWIEVQARLFKVKIQSLILSQTQDFGARAISQLKDILIIFFAAKGVIDGDMTFGAMLAIQVIVGQMNAPLLSFIGFAQAAQDARISIDRMGEVHELEDEEPANTASLDYVPPTGDLVLDDLSFAYNELSGNVLEHINLNIERGKVTAIVGESGSGKTTLVKLLLGFYPPSAGKITVGGSSLTHINKKLWRSKCGAVMQDGYIFSDSIASNIAESSPDTDRERLFLSAKTANIHEFVERLPLGYNTVVGQKGMGLSQGQRQRVLIARAVYKDPDFLFFDEATNALDAKNEKVIVENLDRFAANKTVVVVAHRLSTVKNADKIVVLHQGKIHEEGTHEELTEKRGLYYTLIKNQLELGN